MAERTYPADGIVVLYDAARCIHFAACVRGLPGVFDPARRPWIAPANASPDAIAAVVARCPTGALHAARSDGGPDEAPPGANAVRVEPDGPLFVHGDVTVETADGAAVLRDTRVALCRCGRSGRKPFCDNSHLDAFADPGALGAHPAAPLDGVAAPLRIVLGDDGPLLLSGPVTVYGADGAAVTTAKAALCRCGASANKPFCDGSHRRVGFTTRAVAPA